MIKRYKTVLVYYHILISKTRYNLVYRFLYDIKTPAKMAGALKYHYFAHNINLTYLRLPSIWSFLQVARLGMVAG